MFPHTLGLIPYIPQPVWETSWIRIQAWDVLVALGFVTGAWLAARCARSIGKDPRTILDFAPVVLLAGFVCAHLVHVFFYEPELWHDDPLYILYFWSGLSSYGGFLGAAVAIPIFFRRRGERFWAYADSLAVGMAVAWTIARMGCFVAHDHKGSRSDFFLAVDFPGGSRHDLGLYDALLSAVLSLGCWMLFRWRVREGVVTGFLCAAYAIARFFFDFLRSTDLAGSDMRYAGLTPAQYGSLLLFAFGIYGVVRSRKAARLGADSAESPAI